MMRHSASGKNGVSLWDATHYTHALKNMTRNPEFLLSTSCKLAAGRGVGGGVSGGGFCAFLLLALRPAVVGRRTWLFRILFFIIIAIFLSVEGWKTMLKIISIRKEEHNTHFLSKLIIKNSFSYKRTENSLKIKNSHYVSLMVSWHSCTDKPESEERYKKKEEKTRRTAQTFFSFSFFPFYIYFIFYLLTFYILIP